MADESGHAKVAHRYDYQAANHKKGDDEERVANLCVCCGKFHCTRGHDGIESKCGGTRKYREKDNHCYKYPQESNVQHRSVIAESFSVHVGLQNTNISIDGC